MASTAPTEQIPETGAHTIRPNEAVVYIGFLGAGGFGEIHCVRSSYGRVADAKLRNRSTRKVMLRSQPNTDCECFARKLLRAIVGNVTEEDIENERRAIEKLCDTPHDNIIEILQHGRFSNQSPMYFFDMELCEINLEQYIRGSKTGIRGLVDWEIALKDGQHEFLIIAIMQQLLSGLAFIHDRGEVHRDLTPQNGT
jgi:serine/threonine protein kinase